MTWRHILFALAAALPVFSAARSGHEQSVYPSYYPHEIEISALAPDEAMARLRAGELHAYVGDELSAAAALSEGELDRATSLGSFVVARLNPSSALAQDNASACAAVAAVGRAIDAATFAFRPYPVTPYHGDYLAHADRADAARRLLQDAPALPAAPRVRVVGAGAERLVPASLRAGNEPWDIEIEDIRSRELIADVTKTMNGWVSPRWGRTGWFHAYRLLAASAAPAARAQLDAELARLEEGGEQAEARINLARDLVAGLTAGCRAMVVGYTERHEVFNRGYSTGVENVGFDALEGLRSPMFIRTVKLKDFPWNGWLHLGLEGAPAAAWNPVGGFNDEFGRLMWFAVGDLAMLPSPYDSTWMLNRVSDVAQTPRR
jgi:hypothetical protein